MKTKLPLFLLMFLTCGCVFSNENTTGMRTCPRVQIRSEDAHIKQFAGGQDLFEIQMISYSGHCFYDEKTGVSKAVVSPIFYIKRLTESNVEDVHFSYYLETAEGPAKFLGKKTYFAKVRMTKGVWNLTWQANESDKISIPGEYDVDMYAGIYAHKVDSEEKVK